MKVEEEYLDVLQNIEFGIMLVFRKDRSLLDLDARDALDALLRCYRAEEEQRHPPQTRLAERAQRVFDSVRAFCEWRMGRANGLAPQSPAPGPHKTVAEIILCLRRVRSSIDFWNENGGRQGYLSFVSDYVQ